MSKKNVIVVVVVLFFGSLYPAANKTIEGARGAHGLVILANLSEDDSTYNPYSKNFGIVSPEIAQWILLNMDYPYNQCPSDFYFCEFPLITWAVSAFDPFKYDKEILRNIIKHFVQRGYSVNKNFKGFTPLHLSVLLKNIESCELLLSLGADKSLRINKPEEEYHNYTALQYYEYMKSKDSTVPIELGELLVE